ncbi:MAG: SUMF1/EgtB/PvdO family nonheme iron enzyme [Acidobacteriota bacterium]
MARPVRAFISYSHRDEGLREELEAHLALLRRTGMLEAWTDRKILPGDEWKGEIHDALEAAELVLLLVSADFVASDYCFDVEMGRALERHAAGEARVVPIIVRPCEWHQSDIGKLQAVPQDGKPVTTWSNRDEAWLNVAQRLRGLLKSGVVPGGGGGASGGARPKPEHQDDGDRDRSERLRELRKSRAELRTKGESTAELDAQIKQVKHEQRARPQLPPGYVMSERYELLERLGRGGFGEVWKAYDEEAGELVAVKILRPEHAEDRNVRERFFRGASRMAAHPHPHVVRVLESHGGDDGYHYFVMELLAGGDLEQRVKKEAVETAQAIEWITQVGEALQHAHDHGLVHRDVKPANVLLTADGQAKLADFDLVRAADSHGYTQTRAGLGTAVYAAPEQLKSGGAAEASADTYSLAMTLLFLLAGEDPPYPDMFDEKARRAFVRESVKNGHVRAAVLRALATRPNDRSKSVQHFCDGLEGRPFLCAPTGDVAISEREGVELVRIPAGRYVMGSPEDEEGRRDNETQREVDVADFWLGRFPVTNEEYGRFLEEDSNREKPQDWENERFYDPRQPVVGVTWHDAQAFCEWAGVRLPTEAEWEWACRAGTTTRYWSGDDEEDLARVGWYDENSEGRSHVVGELEGNPFGLHDMHGNVWEWCSDEMGSSRVIRGGSWDNSARHCRAAYRLRDHPGYRWRSLGFRLSRGQVPVQVP